MLYKVVRTFQSMDETSLCDRSCESYRRILSYGSVYYAEQGGFNKSGLNPNESYWKQFFQVVLFTILYKVALALNSG